MITFRTQAFRFDLLSRATKAPLEALYRLYFAGDLDHTVYAWLNGDTDLPPRSVVDYVRPFTVAVAS